jgi:hypothetical protein
MLLSAAPALPIAVFLLRFFFLTGKPTPTLGLRVVSESACSSISAISLCERTSIRNAFSASRNLPSGQLPLQSAVI